MHYEMHAVLQKHPPCGQTVSVVTFMKEGVKPSPGRSRDSCSLLVFLKVLNPRLCIQTISTQYYYYQ